MELIYASKWDPILVANMYIVVEVEAGENRKK